ncbi:MAG: FAD-binding oxidoreductase [Candidatus Omnitrophica bacterium]|nr:FAD-binding oxidoreductase [Candidatus Omnitrophota bacterium]
MNAYECWGRYPKAKHQIEPIYWTSENPFIHSPATSYLAFGKGRSYGDSCLNDGGVLLDTSGLNRWIHFDDEKGVVRCEAGVSLAEVLRLAVPKGWFLPVTPGTKHITVAGAIANDVHGKNHHRAGTFGRHVGQFEIVRSDGTRLLCSPQKNQKYFSATIGGLGLTGLILWAEFSLKRIPSSWIQMETIRFGNLDEFFNLSRDSDEKFEYTLSWIDCFSQGKSLARGLMMRGNHAENYPDKKRFSIRDRSINIPCTAPRWFTHSSIMKGLNVCYFYKQRKKPRVSRVHYDSFFYPLDILGSYNRLFGRGGLLQYQCVLPFEGHGDLSAIKLILSRIAKSNLASMVAVLKVFGNIPSPGMLSFPRKGITLALDLPIRGQKTFHLLEELDAVVGEHHGAVYPAKDARMSGENFRRFFPQWKEFRDYVDPNFSSGFWRRVTQEPSPIGLAS